MKNIETSASDWANNDMKALKFSTLEAITEASLNAILIIDEFGIIQSANRSVLQSFGYTQEELKGRNVSTLMPDTYSRTHDGYLEHYRRTDERKIIGIGREVVGLRKDGSHFSMHLTVNEFYLEGRRAFIGICYDINERHRLTKRIAQLVTFDDLTGCFNRHQFVHMLEKSLKESIQPDYGLGVLFIDLDGFKQVNDNYGHFVGDRLLKQVAERLRGALRAADTLGRVGGDEFVASIILKKSDRVEDIAQRLVDSLDDLFDIDEVKITVSTSIGVSLFPEHGQSASELMSAADIAMYRAKASGGARTCLFNQEMRETNERAFRLVSRLREGLELNEFELYYQLQFDTRTHQPSGMEALLRWHDGDELVFPDQFIPVALKYGLMPAITRWVINQACLNNKWLIEHGVLDVPVAVNVSVDSFADEGFALMVEQVVNSSSLPSERLVLEITEDVAMTGSEHVLSHSMALRRRGIYLAMDDFGTGCSSLTRLRALQFHKLKIDRAFVAMLPGSKPDQEIVRAILSIANALNIQVIAEGIETEEQLAFLRDEGCNEGQGYWFAKPMPLEALIGWLKEMRKNH